MNRELRKDADYIIRKAIHAVLPDEAVVRALKDRQFPGRVILVAAGKAAWQMAAAAQQCLGSKIEKGVVITKYGHVKGEIPGIACHEGGHPVSDEGSFRGTQAALEAVRELTERDTVLFLLSGGGSALFEKPLIPADELGRITRQLLACGADIVEINTIRKRLSAVKGGKFAQLCAPARVFSVVLSDIIGDPLDMIASGPACQDSSTCAQAAEIAEKYRLRLSDEARRLLMTETPREINNVTTCVNGSVRELCAAAAAACRELGCDDETVWKYYAIALMHDIGKVGIPDTVLNKAGKLTEEEFDLIKSHTSRGYDVLKGISLMPEIAVGAQAHHERPDGRGYPNHLKGEEIPRVAQIIAVADCFDAMYSNRPYRSRMNFEKAVSIIKEVSGTQLAPDVVDAFLRLVDRGEFRDPDDHGGGSMETVENIRSRAAGQE